MGNFGEMTSCITLLMYMHCILCKETNVNLPLLSKLRQITLILHNIKQNVITLNFFQIKMIIQNIGNNILLLSVLPRGHDLNFPHVDCLESSDRMRSPRRQVRRIRNDMDEAEAGCRTKKCFICSESEHTFKKCPTRNSQDEGDIGTPDVAAGTSSGRPTRGSPHGGR